jgi:acyl-CoA synthetase (AMP-forming)/AMP-acid ligase II
VYPGTHAEATPDKAATIMAGTGQTVTYGELNAGSNQVAQLIRARGLGPGDGLALMMENHPRYHEVLWGAQRSGLRFTALSSRLTPAEVDYIVNDCGAQMYITSYRLADVAAQLSSDRIPAVHTRLMLDDTIESWESYEEVVGAQPPDPISDETEGTDMLYSSGTTGRPKGIERPLETRPVGSPDSVTLLMQAMYGFQPESVYLSPAPLYHSAPLRFTMAVHRLGGTVVVMEHFDPVQFLELIQRYRVTHTQVVPTMFVRLLKLPEEQRRRFDTSSLQTVIHAAAPCPVPVKQQIIDWWGPVVHEYYAGTEGNGFCAIDSNDWLAHRGSVGRALLGTIHILDDDGTEVPLGEPGAIYFEGGAEFEYHNDPEKTAAARTSAGWSTLGDIGYLDDAGYLYLTDRKAHMIISGGVNIYPQEAENVLTMHPKVADVAVFGVPDEDFGEEVKAVVQPIDMADAGPQLERELIAYCREHLADLKCPRSVDFEAELPRAPTGKLYKRLLRDRYWEGHQTRIL